ncbi:MAG TPA: hypothetical protein VGR71_06190 [Nitrospira sp.]|nr:hypothetical protein [Nitrospira sp.]
MSLDRERDIAEAARNQLYARRGRAERIGSLIADGWSLEAANHARREHDGSAEPDGPAVEKGVL